MEEAVRIWGLRKKGTKLWMPDVSRNGLVVYDLESKKACRVCMFDGYSPAKAALFSDIAFDDEQIILLPVNAKEIGVYSCTTGETTMIVNTVRIRKTGTSRIPGKACACLPTSSNQQNATILQNCGVKSSFLVVSGGF